MINSKNIKIIFVSSLMMLCTTNPMEHGLNTEVYHSAKVVRQRPVKDKSIDVHFEDKKFYDLPDNTLLNASICFIGNGILYSAILGLHYLSQAND